MKGRKGKKPGRSFPLLPKAPALLPNRDGLAPDRRDGERLLRGTSLRCRRRIARAALGRDGDMGKWDGKRCHGDVRRDFPKRVDDIRKVPAAHPSGHVVVRQA